MAWIALVVAGSFEVVWASLLDQTKGFTRPPPTAALALVLALGIGMYLLSVATKTIPIGRATPCGSGSA